MADRRGDWSQPKTEGGGIGRPAHGNIMKTNIGILATVSLAAGSSVASAQTSPSQTTLVTVENNNRAQPDINFAGWVRNAGFGQFPHAPLPSSPPTTTTLP